jgi:N-acetylglucosaminyl-diphospho-decaprenol L-rhamnosyltransferase
MPEHAVVLPPPVPSPVRRKRQRHRGIKPVETPRLSIVIVNYCQWENTVALVRQILRSGPARRGAVEVVVVDNHSPWHPMAGRLRRWPGVSLRRWGRNRGFARAVNEGCRLSRGRWFLLLNPDLSLTDGFLEGALALVDKLTHDDERAGIIGFRLLNRDGSRQLSTGFFPTLPRTLAGLLRPRRSRKYRALPEEQRCRVPWVSGCCLLLRRECAQELGGLDESFFLYYEDVDLCRRARTHKWSVWHEPTLRAVHHDPLHRRRLSPGLRLITRHALLTYGLKHWSNWQFALLAGIVRWEAWARQCWAHWRGDEKGSSVLTALGRIARDLVHGDKAMARRRLEAALHCNPKGCNKQAQGGALGSHV